MQTIEHLMSACAGLGIDNLVVEMTADEVPILDGSSASFVFLLQSAGIVLQDAPKIFVKVLKPVEVRRGEGASLSVGAAGALQRLQAHVRDRVQPPGGRRHRPAGELDMGSGSPRATSRAPAPSASRGSRPDALARPHHGRQHGQRDRGRRLRVLNADGLRYDDEFVKHKILDAIGDLFLVGRPLIATTRAYRSATR